MASAFRYVKCVGERFLHQITLCTYVPMYRQLVADADITIDPQQRPGFINVLEDNSVAGGSAKTTLYDTQV